MLASNAGAINEKTPTAAHIEDGTRQRQARIDLAEADGTEDDEVASELAETVAWCADFNIR